MIPFEVFFIDLPIAGHQDFPLYLLLTIGFMVGTLGGFFGVGGAWIATPALNIFGFRMAYAIGTDISMVFGQSLIATRKHAKMGNVDWRLGWLSTISSVIGLELGKQTILMLETMGHVESVVRWVYMILLLGLGLFMLVDYRKHVQQEREPIVLSREEPTTAEPSMSVAGRLRQLKLPPMISLPTSGIPSISFWLLFGIFLLTGFVSGFMGVGGGFILLPCLIYLIGCPTTVAVGTSLLAVSIMAGYGCFSYSLTGRTELFAAMIMLAAAAVGAQIGVAATRYVKGYGIRLLFAVMTILASLSVGLKQAEVIFDARIFGILAGIVVMSSAGSMTILIVYRLVQGIRRSR